MKHNTSHHPAAPSDAHLSDVVDSSSRVTVASDISLVLSQLKVLRILTIVCGFAGIAAAVVAAEDVFATRTASVVVTSSWSLPVSTNPLGKSPDSDAAKLASTLLTLMLLACVVAKARYQFTLLGLRRQLLPGQHFWETPLFVPTLFELLVCAVCCPVGVYGLVDVTNAGRVVITYDLDSLLSTLMFMRLALLVAMVIREASGFDSTAARIVERSMSLRFDSFFAARHILEARPIFATLVIYMCTIGVCTYAMRVAERPVCVTPEAIFVGWCTPTSTGEPYYKDLNNAWNSAWLIIITSLTVGYGDLFPYTQLGRVISVIAAVAGIILIALLVTAVSTAAKFSFDEERALYELSKRSLMAERRRLASRVVGAAVLFAADRRKRAPVAARTSGNVVNPLSSGRSGSAVLALAPHRRAALAPPSRGAEARLARALRTWSASNDAWVDALRCKDTAGAMRLDVHSVRDALASVNAKLDALAEAVAAGKGGAGGGQQRRK